MPWHIRLETTITFIAFLATQSIVGGIAYGSYIQWRTGVDAKIEHLDTKNAAREAWERDDQFQHNKVDSRLSVLETQNAAIIAALQRIEDRYDGTPLRGRVR